MSCITAIYIALKIIYKGFLDIFDFINKCKGDTDTTSAMSGAIWGACNGLKRFKPAQYKKLEFADEVLDFAAELYEKATE